MTVSTEAAIAELDRLIARESLLDYCKRMSGDDYLQPAQVRALIDALERLEKREITRLIVEMPPRSSKSTHVSRLFPSWWLGKHPSDGVILASYGQDLATGHGRAVRDMLTQDDYPFDTKLRKDVKSAKRWLTVDGGGLITAGVGTGLTGFGGHLCIIDDPIKGREEAESELTREATWAWYQDVFNTRIQHGGVVVVLGTRWHEDDLIGRIIANDTNGEWTRLRIPYIAEANDPLGRVEGEPLELFGTVPNVESGEISAYGFSALYQQRPTPAGGGVFKKEWMDRRYSLDELVALKQGNRWMVIQSVDIGGKQGVGHDPSAIATWGTDGISFYLLDYWYGHDEYIDVKSKCIAKFFEWRPRMMYIEDATWAQPLISDLRRATGVRVAAVKPEGSKWVRADSVSPEFEAGKVVLPQSAPWLNTWLGEHLSFPNAAHDEAVDTTSMALKVLRNALFATPPSQRERVNSDISAKVFNLPRKTEQSGTVVPMVM